MDLKEKFLEGKGVLITGGASGFGKATAYAFGERGADLVLVDINKDLLYETSKEIKSKLRNNINFITDYNIRYYRCSSRKYVFQKILSYLNDYEYLMSRKIEKSIIFRDIGPILFCGHFPAP